MQQESMNLDPGTDSDADGRAADDEERADLRPFAITLYSRDPETIAAVQREAAQRGCTVTVTDTASPPDPPARDLALVDMASKGARKILEHLGENPEAHLIAVLSVNPFTVHSLPRTVVHAFVAKPLVLEQLQTLLTGAAVHLHSDRPR
jgi:hypothetical protein